MPVEQIEMVIPTMKKAKVNHSSKKLQKLRSLSTRRLLLMPIFEIKLHCFPFLNFLKHFLYVNKVFCIVLQMHFCFMGDPEIVAN